MEIDFVFLGIFLVGAVMHVFYDAKKAEDWILKKFEGTIFYPQNKLQDLGLAIILMVPMYFQMLVRFGIMGFIFLRAYEYLGFEKTIIILMIVIYVGLLDQKKQ